jgi:hypothetical protein
MEPEQNITPDCWILLELIHEGRTYQKVLAGWSGSYAYGDSWRLSSNIRSMLIEDKEYQITTESGSTYILNKGRQGLRMSISGIYNCLKEKHGDQVTRVEI